MVNQPGVKTMDLTKSNVLGPIDLLKNLVTAREMRDEIRDTYQQEERYAVDEDQQIIDDLVSSENELDSLLTEFMYDENQEAFRKLNKLAINSNDEAEIGRIYKQILTAGLESYLSFNRG